MTDLPAAVPEHWRPMGFAAVPDGDAIKCSGCSLMVTARKRLESAPWIDHEISAWRCSNCLELSFVVDGDPSTPISDAVAEPYEIGVALADPSADLRSWQAETQRDGGDRR